MDYDSLMDILNGSGWNLTSILHQLDILWLENQITEEERNSLKDYARMRAQSEYSYAPLDERVLTLELALKALEDRVKALEDGDTPTPGPDPEIPEWVQPTGAYNAYNIGDKVRYKGQIYESIIDGNVWAPDVYPAGWREITD